MSQTVNPVCDANRFKPRSAAAPPVLAAKPRTLVSQTPVTSLTPGPFWSADESAHQYHQRGLPLGSMVHAGQWSPHRPFCMKVQSSAWLHCSCSPWDSVGSAPLNPTPGPASTARTVPLHLAMPDPALLLCLWPSLQHGGRRETASESNPGCSRNQEC